MAKLHQLLAVETDLKESTKIVLLSPVTSYEDRSIDVTLDITHLLIT